MEALNEKMGLKLTHNDVSWCYKLQSLKEKSYYMRMRDDRVQLIQCLPESSKGLNKDFLIVSGEWYEGLHCPTVEGTLGGAFRLGEGLSFCILALRFAWFLTGACFLLCRSTRF